MGIPVYFKTIIEDNKQCLQKPNQIDNLFFDLNCLIHPCCVNETDESIMFNKIYEKIINIIDLVKPNFVYIAVDGPCPMPKIKQQRQRRFMSIEQNKVWDTNAITPGTKFMYKLDSFLTKHFTKNNIELSLSTIPGEGEHKIFHYIIKHNLDHNIVYGLDADLIMLSIINPSKISLLRERTEYNIEKTDDEYIYLNIDVLKKSLSISPEDYIFICFFIGNDFIKNTPSVNIRYNGLDVLLNIYNKLRTKYGSIFYLINRYEKNFINLKYFKEFIHELSIEEDKRLKTIMNIRNKQENNSKKYVQTHEERKLHTPIIERTDEKLIFNNMNVWKDKYYSYFELTDPKNIKELCENYLESFIWTIHYYLKGCINWQWCYKYHFAPSLYDLNIYLENINELNIKQNDLVLTPYKQLQMVLPEKSFHLSRRKLSKNKKLEYPNELFKCHLLKRYDWESVITNL